MTTESAIWRRKASRNPQLPGGLLRFDDMRPDYLDREKKTTAGAGFVVPSQPPREEIRRTLRQAFIASEQLDEEWDELLAKIR